MIMDSSAPKLLIVGQTPPPWHGQAVATQMLFDHTWDGWDVDTLRMAYSGELDSVGRFQVGKLGHLFELIRETRRRLGHQRDVVLFYPPASANWVPFLRDVIYLALVRRRAAATVFIFHASGLAKWITQSRFRRWLASKAYGGAEISLEVAVEEISPHEVFGAGEWQWCPCAAEVPEMPRRALAEGRPLEVLFVGSLQEGKGILEIIRTARLLKEQGKDGAFCFKVVGRWFSDSFREEAVRLVKDEGVDEMVHFPGELTGDAKWDAYREADVFFFPSHYESEASPIVLMEALGAGLPLVTTRWRGIPAMVEECDSAWLLPIKDTAAFAAALLELDAGRERATELGTISRNYYGSRFRPEHFLDRINTAIDRRWRRPSSKGVGAGVADGDRVNGQLGVLQVFNQYTEQGGEEVWVDQLSGLGDENFRVHELRFLSRAWKTPGSPSRLTQAIRMWNNPESRQRLRREVAILKPDTLVYHNLIPVGSFGLYQEAREIGVPVLQYVHNFRPFSPSGTLWFKGETHTAALEGRMFPEVLSGAWEGSILKTGLLALHLRRLRESGWLDAISRWIAISEFMRDRFIDAGIPAEKIELLRHCWPAMASLPEQSGVGERGHYLFLGRLVPEKGIGVLLSAWDSLRQRLGDSCPKLVIAGTGPEESNVLSRSRRNPAIEYAGFVSGEAKARLLGGCRALIAPSIWWEPLGLIVYEAYDFGKPVLAARSGGLQETVMEGSTGFLHEPGNPASLAESVLQMEDMDPESLSEMGQKGRAWLLKEASPAAWQAKFLEILHRVKKS